MSPFGLGWKSRARESNAVVVSVVMTGRPEYGVGVFDVTYAVTPTDDAPFNAVSEGVRRLIKVLPQAGQEVVARYDPKDLSHFEVVTPPGSEGGAVTTPTELIGWDETQARSRLWADGSRRS